MYVDKKNIGTDLIHFVLKQMKSPIKLKVEPMNIKAKDL